MKIERRTCKYQYKTYWQGPDGLIMTYGFVKKDLNPNTEKAFLTNQTRKKQMDEKK